MIARCFRLRREAPPPGSGGAQAGLLRDRAREIMAIDRGTVIAVPGEDAADAAPTPAAEGLEVPASPPSEAVAVTAQAHGGPPAAVGS